MCSLVSRECSSASAISTICTKMARSLILQNLATKMMPTKTTKNYLLLITRSKIRVASRQEQIIGDEYEVSFTAK
jgi:hypothetical protein